MHIVVPPAWKAIVVRACQLPPSENIVPPLLGSTLYCLNPQPSIVALASAASISYFSYPPCSAYYPSPLSSCFPMGPN